MIREEDLLDLIDEDENLMMADGFEGAIIGVGRQFSHPPIAVYDYDKCIQILVRQGLSEDEAEEYFSFNVQGAWVGPATPMFLQRPGA